MKKIIFTALSGLPNENSGGPNKVISQIFSKIDREDFDIYYLSKNSFFKVGTNNQESSNNFRLKLTSRLFSISKFYRDIFTSTLYLKYFYNKAIKKISNRIENENWDIIHAHDTRTLFGLLNKKGKVVLTIHSKGSTVNDMIQLYGNRDSLNLIYKNFTELEKKSLDIADVITFPSLAAKELYFEQLNISEYENKTKIIYNGIDLEKINKIIIDEKFLEKWYWLSNYEIKILTVGAHIEAKNIDLILKTFSLVSKENPKRSFLLCIGSGNKTKELIELARKLNVINNVRFISYIPNDEIIRLMKFCNIYISLSKNVIFDYVILEALSCGMNVIASNDGGNREIIQNSNGQLVDIDNLENIAHIILKSKLGASVQAIESVNRFSLENMINEFIKLYD